MAHFGIFYDSIELEMAIENGDIINPYVALVDGELDYNSLQPVPPINPGGSGNDDDDNPYEPGWED